MDFETRGGIPAEIRTDGDVIRVSGYAAVFNEEADIGGMFREVIKPGAFRNAISRDDVAFLINHEGLPLARTRSGTLKLIEDERGLRMESELDPSDPDVARIIPKMNRGDLDKMSFAFGVPEGGQTWAERDDGSLLRTLTELALGDVSIVTSPAYGGTSIALRSLDADRASRELKEHNAAAARARIDARKAASEQKFRGIKPE